MNKHLKILALTFKDHVSPHEISLFRGAVIASIDDNVDVLYHNHSGDESFRQRYPLIQYKSLGGRGAIVCVEEGIAAISQFLQSDVRTLSLGQREISAEILEVMQSETVMQLAEDLSIYTIHNWLALNPDNLRRYKKAEGISERIAILEDILKGNILSMCKGIGVYLDDELKVAITDIHEHRSEYVKGRPLMSFDACFKSNIILPNYIGLGKYASKGYGIITKRL